MHQTRANKELKGRWVPVSGDNKQRICVYNKMDSLFQITAKTLSCQVLCQVKQSSKTQWHESSNIAVCWAGAAWDIAEIAYTTYALRLCAWLWQWEVCHQNWWLLRTFRNLKMMQQRWHVSTGNDSKVAQERMYRQQRIACIYRKRLKSRPRTDVSTGTNCVVLHLRGWVIKCRQAPQGELVGVLCCCLPPLYMQAQQPFAMNITVYKRLLL